MKNLHLQITEYPITCRQSVMHCMAPHTWIVDIVTMQFYHISDQIYCQNKQASNIQLSTWYSYRSTKHSIIYTQRLRQTVWETQLLINPSRKQTELSRSIHNLKLVLNTCSLTLTLQPASTHPISTVSTAL